MTRSRWPGWVYEHGDEPDYRFTFANERTFLAWIRTALALVAGGVALDAIDLSMSDTVQRIVAAILVLLGVLCALAAWVRWAVAERAMRMRRPLPASQTGVLITVGVTVVSVVLAVVLL